MAGHVEHVIDAAGDPEIAVLVAASAVAGEVEVRELAPVSRFVTRLIAPDAAEHRWPRLTDHEFADGVGRYFVAEVIDDCRIDAEERQRRGAGPGRRGARERGD